MLPTVTDRLLNTNFVKSKLQQYKYNVANTDKSKVQFDLKQIAESTRLHLSRAMEAKRVSGMIFVNCMESLL